MSMTAKPVPTPSDHGDARARTRAIGFLNWAHAIDHFVILIFPTVVIGLVAVYGRSYSEMIALSTASFVAFGVFSIPAGWLADRWSRRKMMAAFYLGCGFSLVFAAFAPNLYVLAVALFMLGVFAAIYHPVGMAMLIDISDARGRTLAFNGVCGNVGAALAAGISAALASWLGWRYAFIIPAALCIATGVVFLAIVQDDSHRIGKRETVAKVQLSQRAAIMMFGTYIVISLMSGLTFNTSLVALPKLFDERLGGGVSLVQVGSLATAVFLCGAIAQIAVGRLVEMFAPTMLFVVVVCLQFTGILWATFANGITLVIAFALTMAAIYGQVTLGDIVLARFTADAWRARIYAVRYFLTFVSAGIAVSMIAALHATGGFTLVLGTMTVVAGILVAAVVAFAAIVSGAEAKARAMQPAE
jgi:MFS family permease